MNDNTSNTNKSNQSLREEAILQFWKENDIFKKSVQKDAPSGDFVFYDGPPTANGMPGLHHIEPQSFKDAIPRYKTMQGYRVPRRAGWDTHGLPVELQVEKELGLTSKKDIEQYGVAAFNQKCKESVWKYKSEWMKMRTRMAYWTDMDHAYITYANNYIEALWGVVKKASDAGYLYKDFKVIPWCTRCGTGLSSHELSQPGAYKDVKDLSVYVKFKIVGTDNGYFVAWTTTPWTLPGNVALAVGNDIEYVEAKVGDEILVVAKDRLSVLPEGYEIVAEHKGSEMIGMQYEPLYSYLAEGITGDQKEKMNTAYKVYVADFVTTTDGTGIVHTAVMYGADDFELGTKVGLPKFHMVDEEGRFIQGTGFLEGRYVKEKDENGKPTLAVDIIDELTTRGLLFKKENYMHSYPHCWRCDTPLVYYARTSWYFRMSALREKLLAANESINWEPAHIKQGRFGEWLDGIKDWAISRDRYWGTPLPIWTTSDNDLVVVDSLATLKSLSKKSGNQYFVMRHGLAEHNKHAVWSCTPGALDALTDEGREQVKNQGVFFADKKIDLIITSPFARTQDTARIVAGSIGLSEENIVVDPRIGEWNVGTQHQGAPMEEYFALRKASEDRYQFKSADGESYADVMTRSGAFIYDIEQRYQGKNILIVTHGGPARAIDLVAQGFSYDSLFETTRVYQNFANAEIRQIDFAPLPHNDLFELDMHRPYIDQISLETSDGKPLTRTNEVMDVWFDSGAMPYAQDHVLGTHINTAPIQADYISEAIDQTRGWFYTLHAVSNLLSDEPRAAYVNVICLGHILDANGQKMSKSKGNVVDPWYIFAKYGADPIRFWMYSVNQPGDSKNFDEKTLTEVNNKVFTLLGNVVSFYELYRDTSIESDASRFESDNVLDIWIIARLNQLIMDMTTSLDGFDLCKPTRALREFIDDLSTWYLRRSRDRLKDGDTDAKQTLYFVLKTTAQLFAPFAPFTAEDMWQKLKTESDVESVHISAWPKAANINEKVITDMLVVRTVCTEGNALRKKLNIPVRQPLAKLTAKDWNLTGEYAELVMEELNVKAVINGTETSLDTDITPELKLEGEYRELVRMIQDLRKEKGLQPADVIKLTLPDSAKEIVNMFGEDLKKTVGAKEVSISGEKIMIG